MVQKTEIQKSVIKQRELMLEKPSGEFRKKLQSLKLTQKHILIITGIRRCGKSTLMHQVSLQLGKEFSFFNFEDTRVVDFETSDFNKLDEIFGEDATHYFFDEIQNVAKWEIFIRNLHDRGKTICITGSNASLLSKELGTRLTGRNIQLELFPFSFSEYVSFKKLKPNKEVFAGYLKEGGFPDFLTSRNPEVLQQLFKDIVYRDIIVRHGIRNAKTFIDLALYLISNAAKEYSLNKLKNTFEIGSANSVADYVQWLEDSYMLYAVPRFAWSLKKIAVNPKKIYVIDMGFARANSLSFSEDVGRLFENAVFLQLRRTYKELYYFKEKGECDFVVKELNMVTQVFQVCADLNPDTMKREMNGLIEAMRFFELKVGTILTLDEEDEFVQDNLTVRVIPAWKWFREE